MDEPTLCPKCGQALDPNDTACPHCGLATPHAETTLSDEIPGADSVAAPFDCTERLKAVLSGKYAIERELGRGGMATVYLAEDLQHERRVAVKVMRPELAAAIGTDRFVREIKLAAKLNHPHLLPLFDSGEADGFLYYVMPFVEGESLRDRLNREKQLPVEEAIRLAQEVAAALSYAHSHGVVHRDIKPENILLSHGEAVVADLGIARAITESGGENLTETGLAIGTPTYMSPEQAAGEEVDGRADTYALACVLFEMFTGEPPFSGASAQSLMAKHAMDAIPSPRVVRQAVPEYVASAIQKALGKVPADRFQVVSQFAEALGGFAATAPPAVQPRPEVPARKDEGKDGESPAVRDRHVSSPSSQPRFFGFSLESVVEGEVSDEEIDHLIDEVRRETGSKGEIDRSLGRSLTWTSTHHGVVNTTVYIQPRKGHTTIRLVEEHSGVALWATFSAVIPSGAFWGMGVPPVAIAAGWGIIGVGTLRLASFLRNRWRKRYEGLLDRLKRIAEDGLRSGAGRGG